MIHSQLPCAALLPYTPSMSAAQSAFPDLDAALALERVEVVSSVEIETVKRALRWLFDELQRQRGPAESPNAAITSDDLQALRTSGEEQKAVLAVLQEQQVPCMPFSGATYAATMRLHVEREPCPRVWTQYQIEQQVSART